MRSSTTKSAGSSLIIRRAMEDILAERRHALLPAAASPQQTFDKAVADKDYSRKACLRTYDSRTIIVTGPGAGQELARPPDAPDEENAEDGRWWNLFAGRRVSKTRQPPSTPTPAQLAATVPSYITGAITWVEPGLWNGMKAHFVLLQFEHKRQKDIYLERVSLDIRVWRAGDAVKSMVEYYHKPLAGVSPPLEDLADNAPPIVLYAPRAVVGRPSDSPQPEYYWAGRFQDGDNFRYAADLHAPRERTIGGAKETDPRSLLHIVAFGDNRQRLPPPDFSVALVVLSNGKPFDLTAYDGTFHWQLRPLRHWLWSPYNPARFCKSAKLRPKGQKPIRCDLAGVEMRAKIQELVQWCQPFDTIWFGNDKGCVNRAPGDTRGCSRDECALCRGRC